LSVTATPIPVGANVQPAKRRASNGTSQPTYNWAAIAQDSDFVALHREKTRFLATLMALSVFAYFLLPIGAAYFPEFFKIQLWGPLNVGLVVALSEFLIAWGIAFVYSRRANLRFDALTKALAARAHTIGEKA
jgi:uncharacterized membrane protein (DUF485 family)